MSEIVRPVVSALSVACLAISLAALSTGNALAQAKQDPARQSAPAPAVPPVQQEQAPIKQIALTDKQVENMLAVTKEMDTLTATAPEGRQAGTNGHRTARGHRQEERFCEL